MKRSVSIIVIYLLLSSSVFSQNNNRYLDSLSQAFLLAPNENFILIDAYRDGLLKEGQPYNIVYKENVLRLNERELSGDLAEKYISRIKAYTNMVKLPSYEYFHVEGDNFSLKVASTYQRRYTPVFGSSRKIKTQSKATIDSAITDWYNYFIAGLTPSKRVHDSILICSLYEDKLIDGKTSLDLRFNTIDVVVNKKNLQGGQRTKFMTLAHNAIDTEPSSKTDFVRISFSSYEVMYYINNTNFPASISNISKEDVMIEVYPSPAKDIVNLLVGEGDISFSAKLIDTYGKVLRQSTDKTISISDLPSGVYYIVFSYQNTMQKKRVVVMH